MYRNSDQIQAQLEADKLLLGPDTMNDKFAYKRFDIT